MLREDARWRKRIQIGFVLVGATTTGICEVLLNIDDLEDTSKAVLQTLWVVGIVAVLIGGLILVFVDQSAPDILAEADLALASARDSQRKLSQEAAVRESRLKRLLQKALDGVNEAEATIADLADDIERKQAEGLRLATLYSLTRSALLEGVEAAALEQPLDDASRSRPAGVVLDSFCLFSNRLFGFLDEYWALSVLVPRACDDDVERLVCWATRRSLRHDEERSHREWERGEGCAGLAWDSARECVLPDIDRERSLRIRQANRREKDSDRHRSLAAVPIVVGSTVVGVLCASSSVPNRFVRATADEPIDVETDAVEPLRAIASILAILFALTHDAESLLRTPDNVQNS